MSCDDKDPHEEGIIAFTNQFPADHNPYRPGSEEYQAWEDGWWEALRIDAVVLDTDSDGGVFTQ